MAASRRRSTVVTVGAIALVTTSLSACSTSPDYAGVCTVKATEIRVADQDCDDDHVGGGSHGWYYIPAGRTAPSIGQPVTGLGAWSVPSGSTSAKGGVSAKGGTVAKGGFGGGHGSFGG